MKIDWLVSTDDEDNGLSIYENYSFIDLYIDENSIIGFHIPIDAVDYEEDICNLLLVNGNSYTVILTKELKQELNKLT